jgi:hypothetical protein
LKSREADFVELIELIYAAGFDPADWAKVVAYLGKAFPYAAVALQIADLADDAISFNLANWQDGGSRCINGPP